MKFEPYAYQRVAIERMINSPRLALYQDMGLGKTVEVLTAIQELRLRWCVTRVLVIAPKTVAEATWTQEAERWDHLKELRIAKVLGPLQKRIASLETAADIYIINRENVAWLVDYCRNAWPFDGVVIDESSSFKNPQSKRFKALRRVLPKIKWLVELTGTPAPNGIEDLWAQIYLLDGGERLGRTLTAFREAYFSQDYAHPGQQYRTYTPLPGASEQVEAKIADICVTMKAEDYLELPEYIEDVVPVMLDTEAKKAYRRLERDMLLEVDGATITAGTAAVLNGKLLQLCSGAVYGEAGEVVSVHNCKLDAFLEVVEQLGGQHALVFYWYQHERERLIEALSKTGLRVRVYSGDGDASAWNAGEIDLLLAHPVSCGYGLNLQYGGHHMIWYSLPNWELEVYQQACKRLHRQGQQYPVVSHLLVVKGGMDEAVVDALRSKGDVQEHLLQALASRIKMVNEEE